MAVIVPGILVIAPVPKPEWFAAVTVLMLPTLALDAVACLLRTGLPEQ
jgi:hypothetical protein